ncbi:DNA polymerase subunit Cdc27 [Macleaya cordata]|uniref:DNA polymerase delta subunit 3 n=1 Tax=Macleaya cordata TaxID=56857 RepID=A0A200QPQ8_MACCD|nr:DNA polymerase subunit Cdc27 [Macleaya cordata]
MVGDGTLDIMTEIEALVSDKLQVVSYKWLSRNFSVSSNDAKRLLQEFAEKHGSGLEVIYTLSGWLKNNPPIYNIKLVSGPKLADVKKEFEDNYSIQVYSVQACIPKDPAALWSAEFIQAEELFDQPSNVDNCLRDNRFCGVLNSFVKRNANGSSVGVSPPQPKNAAVTVSSRTNTPFQAPTAPQPHQGKVKQESPKTGQSSAVVGADVKSGNNTSGINVQVGKPYPNREKDTALPVNKKKVQNEKSSSGSGGLLASFWGRASAKSKPNCPPSTNEAVPSPIVTAEAQICAREAIDAVSSDDDDDDDQNVHHKRASNGEGNRKRRVVLDFSDEEEDDENAVSLASPDPPKELSDLDSKHSTKTVVLEKNRLNFEEQKEDQVKIKHDKATERESSLPPKDASIMASKSNSTGILLSKKTESCIPVDVVNKKDTKTDATSNSPPKRRKVLKTRIDERGREVTEVVWEGEESESTNNDKRTTTVTAENRPPAAKKSPALGSSAPSNPVSKAGAKKTGKGGGVKDAKQGNILSFFKRV